MVILFTVRVFARKLLRGSVGTDFLFKINSDKFDCNFILLSEFVPETVVVRNIITTFVLFEISEPISFCLISLRATCKTTVTSIRFYININKVKLAQQLKQPKLLQRCWYANWMLIQQTFDCEILNLITFCDDCSN